MKTLSTFIKESHTGIVSIHARPVHGKHSHKKNDIVSIHARPVHGGHSKHSHKKNVKENVEDTFSTKKDWYKKNDNDHIGKNDNEVHNNLNMSKDEWESHPHRNHLDAYSAGSRAINNELIDRDKGHYHDHWHDPYIKGLDKHLASTSVEHPHIHVYHGTYTWNPADHLSKTENNTLHIPTYLSTSTSKEVAGQFAGNINGKHGRHIIRMKVTKGQKGQYLGSHSLYSSEHEFLMPRGQKLKFNPTPKIVHDDDGHVHVWDAHVIQDQDFHHQQSEPSFKKQTDHLAKELGI